MDTKKPLDLRPNQTAGAQVVQKGERAWHLEIPPGPPGRYRLAQVDDYGKGRRQDFPWSPPVRMSLRARASGADIPGTWGFGLWNNPFGMAILSGAEVLRLPALPNAAWFFFASVPNYLSFRDDLPAQGGLAATFRARRVPPALLALGAPGLPGLLWRPTAQVARRLARRLIRQDAVQLTSDPTGWHTYGLEWQDRQVTLTVDDELVLQTDAAPVGPLGVVIWIDNQYAALAPGDRARFGTLATPEKAWIEVEDVQVVG